MHITVWNEYRHEQHNERVMKIYPDGIHNVIAAGLREHGFDDVSTATLDQPEHGLTDAVLASDRRDAVVGAHGAQRSPRRNRR